MACARKQGAKISLTNRPEEAVEGADCVITDCWVSMGDEEGDAATTCCGPTRSMSG